MVSDIHALFKNYFPNKIYNFLLCYLLQTLLVYVLYLDFYINLPGLL